VFASIDNGGRWDRIRANLPTVAVHDLTVHPRENDLVIGTYGRGVFVGDITPLQGLTADVLSSPLHVFDIEPRARYGFGAIGNYQLYGDRFIEIPNEPDALVINYYLATAAPAGVRISITDLRGTPVAEFTGPGDAGLNRASWNMRAGGAGGRGGRGGGGAGGRGGGGGGLAPTGDYLVTVDAAGQSQTTMGRIRERIR
jgi:hypothetical protein